jgi:broad specificity phosphatase PhoE
VAVEIVFETHSLTVDNETGIATGWHDGRLSERGRALAAELGKRRRDDGIAAVFTSDLGRAIETADIAFGGTAIPVQHDSRLRECDYGDWNGGPVERIAAARQAHIRTPFPGGQSYLNAVEQMAAFLRDLARDWDGHRVLVIGHTATRWALDHLINGVALEDLVDAPFGWREGWTYTLGDSHGA